MIPQSYHKSFLALEVYHLGKTWNRKRARGGMCIPTLHSSWFMAPENNCWLMSMTLDNVHVPSFPAGWGGCGNKYGCAESTASGAFSADEMCNQLWMGVISTTGFRPGFLGAYNFFSDLIEKGFESPTRMFGDINADNPWFCSGGKPFSCYLNQNRVEVCCLQV